MTDIKRVGDAGIHTVEGNLAGSRAAGLNKQRQSQQSEYEEVKNKIKLQNSVQVGRIDDKFNAGSDILEEEFKKRTVGLVSAEEFRKARSFVDEAAKAEREKQEQRNELHVLEQKKKKREEMRRKLTSTLSFQIDNDKEELPAVIIAKKRPNPSSAPTVQAEDGNDDSNSPHVIDGTEDSNSGSRKVLLCRSKKALKNPEVDTSFLPDRDRDIALQEAKQRLMEDWISQQEIIKSEFLEVVYSYWDGSGHRKSIQVTKGTSIGRFLELVKQQLLPEFSELRLVSADSLIYVKEDLIIPQHYTFYDLIITQARGKSGPLFHFDIHDDVRLIHDARLEKDESHPGKIVERRWYEKNKHIFPASRWEVYDPSVQRDKYTIHGDEINHEKKR